MKKLFCRTAFIAITLNLVLFSACKDDENPKQSVLIEATSVLSRSASELQTFLGSSSLNIDLSILKYDIEIFKVKYRTKYKGQEIVASGLVILPATTDEVGMVSFQHGTIVAHRDAPTAQPLSSTEWILYSAIGSAGFIGVVPDFIGFGESNEIFHPYYVEEATATAIVDNLKAAREWAVSENINFNNKLFLAGYSQGGYATMAAHKEIESNPINGFKLTASFPASGGYDVKGVQEYFFGQSSYDQPHYIAYVALSYLSYYDWDFSILSDFFQEPYLSEIPDLFDGSKSADEINPLLTTNITDLITEDALTNIDVSAKYENMVTAFNENSLLDWTPKIKMFMYHGNQDTTVPYQNSVDTYLHFLNNGASANVVTFTTLEGADHGSGIFPYLEYFISEIMILK